MQNSWNDENSFCEIWRHFEKMYKLWEFQAIFECKKIIREKCIASIVVVPHNLIQLMLLKALSFFANHLSTQPDSGYTFIVSGFFCFSIESCPTFIASVNGYGSFLHFAIYCVTGCAPVVINPAIRQEWKQFRYTQVQVGTWYTYRRYRKCTFTVPDMPRDLYIGVESLVCFGFAANVALCARDCNMWIHFLQ